MINKKSILFLFLNLLIFLGIYFLIGLLIDEWNVDEEIVIYSLTALLIFLPYLNDKVKLKYLIVYAIVIALILFDLEKSGRNPSVPVLFILIYVGINFVLAVSLIKKWNRYITDNEDVFYKRIIFYGILILSAVIFSVVNFFSARYLIILLLTGRILLFLLGVTASILILLGIYYFNKKVPQLIIEESYDGLELSKHELRIFSVQVTTLSFIHSIVLYAIFFEKYVPPLFS